MIDTLCWIGSTILFVVVLAACICYYIKVVKLEQEKRSLESDLLKAELKAKRDEFLLAAQIEGEKELTGEYLNAFPGHQIITAQEGYERTAPYYKATEKGPILAGAIVSVKRRSYESKSGKDCYEEVKRLTEKEYWKLIFG
ncbi:MAG: hypothetical protein J6K16_00780 [Alphaproteobacteria bacterium]|nr:hypothetical protein [Alphaproteobacteria bacterium]